MPKTRTIARDSVFRPTGEPAAHGPEIRQGKKQVEKLNRQTAVWLSDDEIDWLDERCMAVKKGGWRAITRSAFIRALIQGSMDREFDLVDVSNERQLVERLK